MRNATQIVVLGNGEILEKGSHEVLLKKQGKYADMWNAQLESQNASEEL